MKDVTQPSIVDIPYEELVKIAMEKANAVVKKEFETATFYNEAEHAVCYTGLAQERFDILYEQFYKELCELKQAKVEESYSEEYLKQELFRTIVKIETFKKVENTLTFIGSFSNKQTLSNLINSELENLNCFLVLAAKKFAKEYTKWTHKFPFDESRNLTKEAKKTYDILFTSKKNKLVKELPENIQKLFSSYNQSQTPLLKHRMTYGNTVKSPRKEVTDFAKKMEAKLVQNDFKGGWEKCSTHYLIQQLREELRELEDAYSNSNKQNIEEEAIDIANFAMMISDNLTKQNGK